MTYYLTIITYLIIMTYYLTITTYLILSLGLLYYHHNLSHYHYVLSHYHDVLSNHHDLLSHHHNLSHYHNLVSQNYDLVSYCLSILKQWLIVSSSWSCWIFSLQIQGHLQISNHCLMNQNGIKLYHSRFIGVDMVKCWTLKIESNRIVSYCGRFRVFVKIHFWYLING